MNTRTKKPVCGIGTNDVKGIRATDPVYRTWVTFLRRVGSVRDNGYPSPTISQDWLRLSKFAEWYKENSVKKNAVLSQYDSTLLSNNPGVTLHYSAETTVQIPACISKFFVVIKNSDVLGATLDKNTNTYYTFNKKNKVYGTKEECHKLYLMQKLELMETYICIYELQPNILELLYRVCNKLQYHIDNNIQVKNLYDLCK